MKPRLAAVAFVGCLIGGATADAQEAAKTSSVWTRAARPSLDRPRTLVDQAERLLVRRGILLQMRLAGGVLLPPDPRDAARATILLREARRLLDDAGAKTSRDPSVRFLYAEILYDDALGSPAGSEGADTMKTLVTLLEGLAKPTIPAPIRADALNRLALSYGRLGRYPDEVRAYTEALKLEPHNRKRSIMLANRAETLMLLGDLARAVDGYRASLAELSPTDMALSRIGVTTLWGLGVALDRSGDLDQAMEAIALARAYDPTDQQIRDESSWTFVPPYDEAWYKALGHWLTARRATLQAVRAESFAAAVSSWEEYIARAPAADHYLPVAKARLRMCEKERDAAALKRDTKPGRSDRPARRSERPDHRSRSWRNHGGSGARCRDGTAS